LVALVFEVAVVLAFVLVLGFLAGAGGGRERYERALAIFEKTLPPEHPYIKDLNSQIDI